jgi:acetoin utilization deacetylase AcuC-like enzyme
VGRWRVTVDVGHFLCGCTRNWYPLKARSRRTVFKFLSTPSPPEASKMYSRKCALLAAFLGGLTPFLLLNAQALTSVPVYFDSTNCWHRDIQYHPEQPARIEACIKALRERVPSADLMDVSVDDSTLPNGAIHRPFSEQELSHARDMLIRVHTPDLVTDLEKRCRDSRQRRIDEGKVPLGFVGYIDDDTYLTTETYDVCLRATAAWIRAVDIGLSGKRTAMALTRPPGHHATTGLSNGFCVFNFAAAAAVHALESNPNLKISIFDWDVHYGQGVADIVKNHPRARYVSIHQSPAFPYMGDKREVLGEHNNILTLPIVAETTWSCGYQNIFEKEVLPFLKSESWEPDLILICAGYDALDSDELASVSLQARDYGEMTRQILQTSQAPLILGLEGGYQLSEMAGGGNLADAVVETVQELVNAP